MSTHWREILWKTADKTDKTLASPDVSFVSPGGSCTYSQHRSLRTEVPDSQAVIGTKPQSKGAQQITMSWVDWKAQALNNLFLERGTSGQPGRITAATIRHGEGTGGTG